MLLLAWTPVTHNSNRASVHVNVAQDLPTFHSSLHKIIKSQKTPKMLQTATPSEVFQSSLAQEFCSESISLYSTPLSLSG